jgi:hypothetical protein
MTPLLAHVRQNAGHDETYSLEWEAANSGGKLSGCAKRGCCRVLTDYQSFGVGCPTRLVYCLEHIPLRYRVKVWWQERRRP